jgi:hypothetical protein
MEGQIWLVTFKQNHVKLTLAFMNIMNVIHHSRILQMICQRIISSCIFWQINQTWCTHWHVWLKWSHTHAKGDPIFLCVYQGTKSHQCEKHALVGGPKIIFCSWWSRNSKISLNKWPNKTKQLCSLRHIWWASLQMWYR